MTFCFACQHQSLEVLSFLVGLWLLWVAIAWNRQPTLYRPNAVASCWSTFSRCMKWFWKELAATQSCNARSTRHEVVRFICGWTGACESYDSFFLPVTTHEFEERPWEHVRTTSRPLSFLQHLASCSSHYLHQLPTPTSTYRLFTSTTLVELQTPNYSRIRALCMF